MNKYLPNLEELKPYLNKAGTFFECGFNDNFSNLSFEQKLQIINDIVRQSMIVDDVPNPLTDIEELRGDCHTAATASIEYMKSLGVGKNHRYVICQQRFYDPEGITSRHAAVLVDDEEGNTYYFDATPYVGFMYGRVAKLNGDEIYKYYEDIDGAKYELMKQMRDMTYRLIKKGMSEQEIAKFLLLLEEAKKYPILHNMIAKCYAYIATKFENRYERDLLINEAFKLNPYKGDSPEAKKNKQHKREMILSQLKKWQEELRDLVSSGRDLKRQLEIAQYIYQETKLFDQSLENWVDVDGTPMRIANLTPRFMLEHGLNIVMIKPSADFIGAVPMIKNRFCQDERDVLHSYTINLASPTKLTGITPLLFTHPMGGENMRAYTGRSEIILMRRPAKELYETKKQVRGEFGQELNYTTVEWTDGKEIFWHPFLLNHVHSSDNPSEASLNLNNGYPEQQTMTRFMYPNPKLIEEEEKEDD